MVESQNHVERARQIYHNVFEEVFITNCGQDLSLIQVKSAFEAKLGESYTEDLEHDLEGFFYGADEDNVSGP